MSYNPNLAYFLKRLEGVSVNRFQIQPQNSTSATANKVVRFTLPQNALINTKNIALHFSANADQVADQGGRLPAKIDSLIDRYSVEVGGVQVASGFNGYGLFKHLKDALSHNKCDAGLGHPEMVRQNSYVDNSVIAGIGNETYASTNNQTQFCIDKWEGMLGSLAPCVLDSSILPTITLTLFLASDDVLSSVAGIGLRGSGGNTEIVGNGNGGARWSMENIRLVVETFGLPDATYDGLVEGMMEQQGFLELSYKNIYSFENSHTGSSRVAVSSQSVDRVWCAFRDTNFSTQGGVIRVEGHKGHGGYVSSTSGGNNDFDVGIPSYDYGGVLGTNSEKYVGKYFNMKEGAAAGKKPTYQLQVGGAYVPQFKATAEEMLQISKSSVEEGEMDKVMTLDQYKTNFFGFCVRFNLPNSEELREVSGLNTKGMALDMFINSDGQDTRNLTTFVETSASLRVGSAKQIEVLA